MAESKSDNFEQEDSGSYEDKEYNIDQIEISNKQVEPVIDNDKNKQTIRLSNAKYIEDDVENNHFGNMVNYDNNDGIEVTAIPPKVYIVTF